jgi:hypothetical protein
MLHLKVITERTPGASNLGVVFLETPSALLINRVPGSNRQGAGLLAKNIQLPLRDTALRSLGATPRRVRAKSE